MRDIYPRRRATKDMLISDLRMDFVIRNARSPPVFRDRIHDAQDGMGLNTHSCLSVD